MQAQARKNFSWIQKSVAPVALLGTLLPIHWFKQKAPWSGPEATAHPPVPGHLHRGRGLAVGMFIFSSLKAKLFS